MTRGPISLRLIGAAMLLLPSILAACASSGASGLPSYAYRSAAALKGYQIAVAQGDLLAQMPCYCGCGQDPRYKNLRDCFMDEKGKFNSHGANCAICTDEAEDVEQWREEGLTAKQIREHIDGKYQGRGKPTDTPPVVE